MGKICARELDGMAKRFVDEQSTMSLSTAENGVPWATPLFYVHLFPAFYFFSSPASRHTREALSPGLAAASISGQAFDWKMIRGIQMSGKVERVGPGEEGARALGGYMRKFSGVSSFFKGEKPGPAAFRERFGVRLYRFSPEVVYYLDNSIGFGFREAVRLGGVT